MAGSSLGPLTRRQRLFWVFAIAVLLMGLLALIAVTWPGNYCGGSC